MELSILPAACSLHLKATHICAPACTHPLAERPAIRFPFRAYLNRCARTTKHAINDTNGLAAVTVVILRGEAGRRRYAGQYRNTVPRGVLSKEGKPQYNILRHKLPYWGLRGRGNHIVNEDRRRQLENCGFRLCCRYCRRQVMEYGPDRARG